MRSVLTLMFYCCFLETEWWMILLAELKATIIKPHSLHGYHAFFFAYLFSIILMRVLTRDFYSVNGTYLIQLPPNS